MKAHRYANMQANAIEAVTHQYGVDVHVQGGTVGPRIIRFDVALTPGIRYAALQRLADELALALRTQVVDIGRDERGIYINVARQDPRDVGLLAVLDQVGPVPASTATLGISSDGCPLLVRLSSADVPHALVAGTTGSGKTVLLRTIVASLALVNAPGDLALVIIDPKGRSFAELADIPHVVRMVGSDDAPEALASLVRLMELRDARDEPRKPRVVVVIDELADLLMDEPAADDLIKRLAQRGREACINLIAATQYPSAAILSGVMRANFPLRLVGRVVSAQDARIAAGRGGTDAHQLAGRGDFLAATGGATIRFQAATIEDELDQVLDGIHADGWRRSGGDLLPEVDVVEVGGDDDEGHDIPELAGRLSHWLEENGREWGWRTAAIQYLFGEDKENAGHWSRLLQKVEAEMEKEPARASSAC